MSAEANGMVASDAGRYATAELYDAARRLGMNVGFRPLSAMSAGARFAGPAYTVKFAPPDGSGAAPLNFYDIIAGAPKGSVLVIQADADVWLLGANTSRFAELTGMVGIVTDGCVRDSDVLRQRGYPIFSKGASPVGYSGLLTMTSAGGTIQCGGVTVSTGDMIVADDDGVVSISASRLEEVLYEAADIVELDKKLGSDIEAGRPLPELHETRLRWSKRRAG